MGCRLNARDFLALVATARGLDVDLGVVFEALRVVDDADARVCARDCRVTLVGERNRGDGRAVRQLVVVHDPLLWHRPKP